MEGEKGLLARMLNRFMLSGSVPDPRAALLTQGGDHHLQVLMAAAWRLPTWVLWPPVLRALASRGDDVVAAAPLPAAAIAELWLRVAPTSYPGRDEAARLCLAAGLFVASASANDIHLQEDQRDKLWTAFLAAGAELPDEVAALVADALTPESDEEAWFRVDSEPVRKALMAPTSLVPMMLRHAQAAADLVLLGLLREPSGDGRPGPRARLWDRGPYQRSGPAAGERRHCFLCSSMLPRWRYRRC